jgi:hypothetical protein
MQEAALRKWLGMKRCNLGQMFSMPFPLDKLKAAAGNVLICPQIGTIPQSGECPKNGINKVEARVGIEPTYKGFADLSLTTWVPRRITGLRSLAVAKLLL